MPDICPECGAPLPDGGTCRDNFHALLALEAGVPRAAGTIVHFYTVACYGLQHPDSMNYTGEALAGLRAALEGALGGRTSLHDLRRRVRRATNGCQRVTRRAGDAAVPWHRGRWPMTVADMLRADAVNYADLVMRWARSIRDTLATGLG
jgi:hypothetical protein